MIESRNKTTKERLTMIPEWTANATLSWQANEKFYSFLSVNHIGKLLYEAPNAKSTNNYVHGNTTFDIGMNYDVNKNLTLRAGIKNFSNNIAKTDDDNGEGYGRSYYAG